MDTQYTQPPWTDDVQISIYPKLEENKICDVCVVGAGVAGLTTAYLLAKLGKNVCVVDSQSLGGGQTGQTTAHVTAILDQRYFEVIKMHGLGNAKLVMQSHLTAIEKIRQIIENEKISCDLVRLNGYLNLSRQSDDHDELINELFSLHQVGLTSAKVADCPLAGFADKKCLLIPDQMQIHPLKYLQGLATAFEALGGSIYCQTPVMEIDSNDAPLIHVRTSSGVTVSASSVVVATNTPINNTFAIHTKQVPFRTYAVAFRVQKDSVPSGLYWDDENPYHYLRTHRLTETHDLFIVGGEDHKTGQNDRPELCFDRLIAWTSNRFSFVEDCIYRWSGQVMEPIDGLPFLGHNPMDNENVFVITGHSGLGFSQSTIGAMLISDQIMKIKNPWEDLYRPSRFSIKTLGKYLKENGHVAAQYKDWFTNFDLASIDSLADGEGAVISEGLRKMAVYRAPNGVLEFYSAVCPHLGGVVHWNSVEKSWDCPCHGSRFNCNGKAIEGPAVSNLMPINPDEHEPVVLKDYEQILSLHP